MKTKDGFKIENLYNDKNSYKYSYNIDHSPHYSRPNYTLLL